MLRAERIERVEVMNYCIKDRVGHEGLYMIGSKSYDEIKITKNIQLDGSSEENTANNGVCHDMTYHSFSVPNVSYENLIEFSINLLMENYVGMVKGISHFKHYNGGNDSSYSDNDFADYFINIEGNVYKAESRERMERFLTELKQYRTIDAVSKALSVF